MEGHQDGWRLEHGWKLELLHEEKLRKWGLFNLKKSLGVT